MAEDDQISHILSELELNEYEIRAYLCIIEGGIMVARDISDRTGIPYAKVYQTLTGLIEKRLIIGDEGRPKRFNPRSPADAIQDRLSSLEQIWKINHSKRVKQLNRILPELETMYNSSSTELEEEQGVWTILGSTNISNRISKLVQMTEREIMVVVGDYNTYNENFSKHLKDTNLRTVLITNADDEISDYNEIVKFDNLGNAIVLIFDDFAMLSIAQIQHGKYNGGEFTSVLTQIKELVHSTRQTYEVILR